MELLIDESNRTSVRSLFDGRLSLFPDEIAAGDVLALSVGLVDRIRSPWNSRLFTPQSLASTTFRAALGSGFVLPVAGSFTISFEADTTGDLPFDISADELETELNALDSVIAAGGIDVTGEEGTGFYVFTFRAVGARTKCIGDESDLVPLSILDFQEVVQGDVATREVQTLRIVQNAGAVNTLSTAAASAAATMTAVTVGSGSANAQWRLALTGNIYKGSFTISKTTATTGTSAAIPFDDTEAQIKAKLEATTGIGSGNVSVLQEDERTYLIEFIGSLALTAVTLTVNGANLTAVPELTGNLDLRTPGTILLMNGHESKVVTLEIEKTVGAEAPVKVLQRDVLLVRPVLNTDDVTSPAFEAGSQSGLTPIGNGVDLIAVVFPYAFAVAPTQVLAIIEKPSGGDNIFATVRRDTISTTGFTAELSGTTPDANHKLSWVAIR